MSEQTPGREIVIFTGRFGSGKTEVALNYAVALARGTAPGGSGQPLSVAGSRRPVVLIDLDIVTPYFRLRETAERMQADGVEVIAPSIIGQHLDTPALTPQILGAIEQPDRPVVLDVGGDKQGARALGQYSPAILRRGYVMHFLVNPYRPFTSTVEGVADSIAEIEESSRLRVTSLVSNPNLMGETTAGQILQGHSRVRDFARALDLSISFVCRERRWAGRLDSAALSQPVLIIDRYFVQPWEQT